MAIAYSWKIDALDCAPSEDGMTDVVKIIHWGYTGTDTEGITFTTYGYTSVPSPNPSDFTPYQNLTTAQVSGWLESVLDMPELQQKVSDQISLIRTPAITPLPLP